MTDLFKHASKTELSKRKLQSKLLKLKEEIKYAEAELESTKKFVAEMKNANKELKAFVFQFGFVLGEVRKELHADPKLSHECKYGIELACQTLGQKAVKLNRYLP